MSVSVVCKICGTIVETQRSTRKFCSVSCQEKNRRQSQPEKYRADYTRRNIERYGITVEEYKALLKDQDGKCFICQTDQGLMRFCIDHDHETGRVRGLLCIACNALIGNAKEDPEILMAAVGYLDRWQRLL